MHRNRTEKLGPPCMSTTVALAFIALLGPRHAQRHLEVLVGGVLPFCNLYGIYSLEVDMCKHPRTGRQLPS